MNANENVLSWIVWMIGNTAVGIYSYYKQAYSTAIMSFIILVMLSISGAPTDDINPFVTLSAPFAYKFNVIPTVPSVLKV